MHYAVNFQIQLEFHARLRKLKKNCLC